jgi:hypothetical protein
VFCLYMVMWSVVAAAFYEVPSPPLEFRFISSVCFALQLFELFSPGISALFCSVSRSIDTAEFTYAVCELITQISLITYLFVKKAHSSSCFFLSFSSSRSRWMSRGCQTGIQ